MSAKENEIATQAGLPRLRLVPKGISRMMSGSFIQACDVEYSGTLESGVEFEREEIVRALSQIRKTCFTHKALFRGMNGNEFGERLRKLIDDRSGDYIGFAANLGVNRLYLDSLMAEPFAVSNPSARLLKRISALLNVSVGYLLGETFETDPALRESLGTWNNWVESTPGLDAGVANRIKKEWQDEYGRGKKEAAVGVASLRSTNGAMHVGDWDKRYQQEIKSGDRTHALRSKKRLFFLNEALGHPWSIFL